MARVRDKIIGHESTLQALLKAAGSGRLASSLLFVGPEGVGKKMAANALAQELLCERPLQQSAGRACGACGACLRVEKETSESILTVRPEGQQIKIEQAREVLQFLGLRMLGRARLVFIPQAHLLGLAAQNALLKAIEEPPLGSYFVLQTPVPSLLLPTIRSRTQRMTFRPLSAHELRRVLGQDVEEWVLGASRGSVGKARQMLDQQEDFSHVIGALEEFFQQAPSRLPVESIQVLKEGLKDKAQQTQFHDLLLGLLGDVLRTRAGLGASGLLWESLQSWGGQISKKTLDRLLAHVETFDSDFSRNVDRGLWLENLALISGADWRR